MASKEIAVPGKEIAVIGDDVLPPYSEGVDLAEVPSAKWGWSRINYRTWHATGLFMVIMLMAMLRGNHVGHVEDIFLFVFTAIVLFALVRDIWGRRRGWLR